MLSRIPRRALLLGMPVLVLGGCNAIFGIDALAYDRRGSGGETATTSSAGGGGRGGSMGAGAPTGAGGAGASGAAGGSGGQGGQGGVGPVASVPCGGTPCDVSGGAVCCMPRTTSADDPICVPAGQTCESGFAPISCDLWDDCAPGEVCCGEYNLSQQFYDRIACATDCPGTYDFVLCDPNEDPARCVDPDVCQQSGTLPAGYFICR